MSLLQFELLFRSLIGGQGELVSLPRNGSLSEGISELFAQECLIGKIAAHDHGMCCVCLSMKKAGDEARLLKCRHLFHRFLH